MFRIILLLLMANPILSENIEWKLPLFSIPIRNMSISDDNTELLATHRFGYYIYDLTSNEIIYSEYSTETYDDFRDGYFINNNTLLLFENEGIYLHNFFENQKKMILGYEEDSTTNVIALNRSNTKFAIKKTNNVILLFDINEEKILKNIYLDINKLTQKDDEISDLTFSLDNKYLLILTQYGYVIVFNINDSNILKIFDCDYKKLPEYKQKREYLFEIISDSTFIMSYDNYTIWNFFSAKIVSEIKCEGLSGLTLTNDLKYFISEIIGPGYMPYYYIYNLVENKLTSTLIKYTTFGNKKKSIQKLRSSDQIIYHTKGALELYDFIKNEPKDLISPFAGKKLQYSRDGHYLYSVGLFGVSIINVQTGKIEKNIMKIDGDILSDIENLSNDSKFLLAGRNIYDLESNRKVYSLPFAYDLSEFTTDSKYLGLVNNQIQDTFFLFDLLELKIKVIIPLLQGNSSIESISFSNDNKFVLFTRNYNNGSNDYFIYDLISQNITCVDTTSNDIILKLKFYQDNDHIIGNAFNRSKLSFFSCCRKNDYQHVSLPGKMINSFITSPDEKYTLVSTMNSTPGTVPDIISIVDNDNKSVIKTLATSIYQGSNMQFSPDSKYLAYRDSYFLYYYNFDELLSIQINNQQLQNMIIYPNPTKTKINLMNPRQSNGLQIYIFDLYGNQIRQLYYNQLDLNNLVSIDVSDLPAGVYFVIISDGKEIRKQMFVKK